MKTIGRGRLVVIVLVGILSLACNEEKEISADEAASEDVQNVETGFYFPPLEGDIWETKNADELGWNIASLNEAIEYAREMNSFSLIILHKGKIITENYWGETGLNSRHNIGSVSKSMMAFILGILQEDGQFSINDKVSEIIGTGWSKADMEIEKQITVKHLLTMSSGLNDQMNYIGDPGKVWYYSHTAYNILFQVLDTISNIDSSDFFEYQLFSKIGFANYDWKNLNLHTTARDLARFGLLIHNKGKWNNVALLNDEGYFSEMVNSSQPMQEAYGYLWWLNGKNGYLQDSKTIPGPLFETMPDDAWLAMGILDQRIEVVPSLDLVVVRQGDDTNLPEFGVGSFDYELWTRLMKAINGIPPGT